ncbi:hypothetical protein Gotur_005431, partial [Gossypium turneri]
MEWCEHLLVANFAILNFVLPSFAKNMQEDFLDAQNLQEDFLDAQNNTRAKVNVEPLAWDDQVAAYSLAYAEQRIGDCNLVHSEGPYRENIAMGTDDVSIADALEMWIEEKVYYDHCSNSCATGEICGHYTQVVWRDSIHIGCAK